MITTNKKDKRTIRHRRIRAAISGSAARPRLALFKSNARIVAQLIDDESATTLASVSSTEAKGATPMERAIEAGKLIAKRGKEKGIEKVVFDRGGYKYMGSIKAFADSAREAGLIF